MLLLHVLQCARVGGGWLVIQGWNANIAMPCELVRKFWRCWYSGVHYWNPFCILDSAVVLPSILIKSLFSHTFCKKLKNTHIPVPYFWGTSNLWALKKSHSRLLHGSARHETGPNLLLGQEHTSTSQCNSHLITKVVSAFFVSSENYTVGGVPFWAGCETVNKNIAKPSESPLEPTRYPEH